MQAKLIRLQRMEATEAEVYRRLAKRQKDAHNKRILNEIADDEKRHEATLAERTGVAVKPRMLKVRWHMLLARIFGITFAVKLMERVEVDAAETYRELGLHELAEEEDAHEAKLIGMLEEERLQYAGSIVLGMSDALVELTGALAGLTFAFGDLKMVAVAGLVMGIAAAFSMGASEFLSTRAEKSQQSPVKAAFITWLSYLLTVLLLVAPYLVIGTDSPDRYGFEPHIQALIGTFAVGITIIAAFNFHISVVEEVSFRHRFLEMTGILAVVSLISYAIGIGLRSWLGA